MPRGKNRNVVNHGQPCYPKGMPTRVLRGVTEVSIDTVPDDNLVYDLTPSQFRQLKQLRDRYPSLRPDYR